MALSTKNPDSDEKFAPAAWDDTAGKHLSSAEQAALQDIEDNYDQDADNSTEDANIQHANEREKSGSNLVSKDKKSSDDTGSTKSKRQTEKDERGNKRDKLALNFMKKKGPMALIGLLLAGGGGLFTALLSPGLAIVQLKEALMDDLNDSVSAMDNRAVHIFRAKMKQQVKGLCTKQVSVRCKYQSMSKTQVKKLAKAGIQVNAEPERRSLKSGRYHVKSISYIAGVDEEGKRITRTVTPSEFKDHYRTNADFRSKMNSYYSAKWYSVRGPDMDSVKNKFKLSFKRLINGKNTNEMRDQINRNVTEGASERDGRKVSVVDGKYVDENGNVIMDKDGNPLDPNAEEKKISELKKLTSTGAGKTLTTGLKATNMYTGTQTAVCGILKLMRMAGIAARNMKFAQSMRYAVPFLNTADSIKAGTATPEATAFVGDILTHQDMRDMVLTEASLPTEEDSAGKKVLSSAVSSDPADISPQPNPNKGKDAMDAPLVKASMHGTTSDIGLRESLASLSGSMGSTMVALVDEFRRLVPGQSENQCAFWLNPIVQGAGFILSAATIAISCVAGCAAVIPGIAKAAATTAVVIFATVLLTNKIQDMVDGKTFTADSEGYDAGGGIASGTAALGSAAASSKGMNPISTPEEIKERDLVAMEYKARDIEVQQLEAQDTPYDIYNQYSFLGSIAWSLAPIARSSSSTVASAITAPIQLISSVPSWFAPKASALVASGPERYTKCDDEVFERINLDSADMMCNIRWGMSDAQLNADPQKVAQWMVDSCQVDPISGELNPTGRCEDVCKPDNNCSRAGSQEEAMAMLNSSQEQIASAMSYDDEGIDKPIANSQTATHATQAAQEDLLPPGITDPSANENGEKAEEDVRTYAHFLRYCRFGPEEGARTVNFGDPDGKESNVLTGLNFQAAYSSVGKECLVANNCDPNNPAHANPNEAFVDEFDEEALWFCRPPQYDIYAVYTMDKIIEEGMDQEEEGQAQDSGDGLVTGEAKELACQILKEDNIELVDASKNAMQRFCDTGEATNACGEKYGINPLLSGVMLTMAKNWKMKVNNFGFMEDRSFCDSSPSNQHRMGNAIDLNGLEKVSGGSAGSQAWGSLNFSGGQTALIKEFAVGWMDALATKEPTRGRSGQLGCGGFNLIADRKPNWEGHDGNLHFDDSCDHLHIDVGDRVDASKR